MVKKIFLFFIFLFYSSSFAQNISAKASTDKTDYLVGDFIHYKIIVNYNQNIKIFPPALPDSLQDLIVKTEDPLYTEKNGNRISEFPFILSKYDSAGVIIPPINIYYRAGKDTLKKSGIDTNDVTIKYTQTNPVQFTVRLVNVDLKKDIKDVKDPKKIPFDIKSILIWILIALVLAGILFYFYRKYKAKKIDKPVVKKAIILPPHVIALNSLKALEEKQLWQNGKIKEYHSEITDIIRKYFSGRFGLPALELTTSETLQLLRNKKDAEKILSTTQNFLENADLVKFAKFSPIPSVNEEMIKQAYQIVENTIESKEIKSINGDENV